MRWDFKFSQFLFGLEGGAWNLKDNFVTETLIHVYGKYLALFFYFSIIVILIFSYAKNRLTYYQRGLVYLLSSTLVATLLISFLKSVTQIDCPWSIADLGGDQAYMHWVNLLFRPHDGGRCFPSGHASAAYAFFSLYFFSYRFFPKKAISILIAVFFVGLIFGIAQQLRGAHFISHDLTTAFLCWNVNLLFYYLFLEEKKLYK